RLAPSNLVRALDRPLHLTLGIREHDLGTERLEELTPLEAHAGGHRENAAVALHGADERETDARVPARRLDDHATGRELARPLGELDHREADAVLDRPGRVGLFHLRPDVRSRCV